MNNMHTCVAQRHLCNTATQGGEREGEEEGEGEGEDLEQHWRDRQLHGVSRLPWNQHKNHIPRASPFTATWQGSAVRQTGTAAQGYVR